MAEGQVTLNHDMDKTFKNPVAQWCYDNRTSHRQALIAMKFSQSMYSRIFTEDPNVIAKMSLETAKRVQDHTGVDLYAWFRSTPQA